ncbi:nucleoside triphosphate pyrophosphohydrolase [Pelovirga terrestris]|uniref:MazG family protein n=1 Tax=Pelovirga terrestris TaxID=2771352 RepID=A0A8J6QLV5_9BACT|nr:MazG family protein [Pelovirga terrestris]MBD1399592.1 MazG family protein [Pelovirga terrestris]
MSETPTQSNSQHDLSPLATIMATLRAPHGCPWDQQQTPLSLKSYILEEAYELLEAIDSDDPASICDELGDLLLQVVFLAQIYHERRAFDLTTVIEGICAKMVRRHPHVFADADSHGHAQRWEQIKQQERLDKGLSQQLAQRLPPSLPALKRTQKLIKKTDDRSAAVRLQQLHAGQQELEQCLVKTSSSKQHTEDIVAQLLFDLTGLAVALGIDAEDLLRRKTTTTIAEMDGSNAALTSSNLTNS